MDCTVLVGRSVGQGLDETPVEDSIAGPPACAPASAAHVLTGEAGRTAAWRMPRGGGGIAPKANCCWPFHCVILTACMTAGVAAVDGRSLLRVGLGFQALEQHMPTQSIKKRSVVLRGRKTSISLEKSFWQALQEIAAEQRMSLSRLVAEIDDRQQEGSNLSSSVRLYILEYFRSDAAQRRIGKTTVDQTR